MPFAGFKMEPYIVKWGTVQCDATAGRELWSSERGTRVFQLYASILDAIIAVGEWKVKCFKKAE